MHPDPDSRDKERAALEALVEAYQHGPDAGLAKLEGKDDPDSIRRKLIILLENNRVTEAVEIVHQRESHELWCELSIQALIRNNEIEEAERVLAWSKNVNSRPQRQRCAYVFAHYYNDKILSPHTGRILSPHMLSPSEKLEMNRVGAVLAPLLAYTEANGRIETEIEESAVELGLQTAYLQNDKSLMKRLVNVLATKKPVSLELARFVMRGGIDEFPKDLPERLQNEHPDSFEAQLIALHLNGIFFEKFKPAFDNAKQLVSRATTTQDKMRLWHALDLLSGIIGAEAISEADAFAPELLKENQFELNLWKAKCQLRAGNLDAAGELLDQVKNVERPEWLKAYADYQLGRGWVSEALKTLQDVSALLPHPALFAHIADIALNAKLFPLAQKFLQQLSEIEPTNVLARKRLASALLGQEDYIRAAEQFAILNTLEPTEITHLINQAKCLESASEPETALEIYKKLNASANPPFEAIIGAARILRAMDKPEAAFEILLSIKEKYWNEPSFVGAFMDLAHAAQQDAAADEALQKLQQLQAEGKAQNVLRPFSLDEIQEQMREFQTRKEELNRSYLVGKLPWLLVDELSGHVPYWGWFIRTQELNWLFEDPQVRADFTLYATNSFYVKGPEGERFLEEIQCPPKNTPVAVDLSSLITLHRLELLDKGGAYFGKALIPSSYLAHSLEQGSRLVLHQKSQKTSLEQIKAATETGKIQIRKSDDAAAIPHVHEYTDEPNNFYRIIDIADALFHSGKISDSKYTQVKRVAHKPTGTDADHKPLQIAEPVLIDISTLKTLHTEDILTVVLDSFLVQITAEDGAEIRRDMRSYSAKAEAYEGHSELWKKIRKNQNFVIVPFKDGAESKKRSENITRDIILSALTMAQQQKIPLLTDDRFCQSLSLNQRRDEQFPAFGTDSLLEALYDEKLITADEWADHFIQLIQWRYRFLVPSPVILKTLALRFLSHPPGNLLRQVARYGHECMIDPGLLCGVEETQPPSTVGHRLMLKWSGTVAEFSMGLWGDETISEEKAHFFTVWGLTELLPTAPRNVGEVRAEAITSLLPRTCFSQALAASLRIQNTARANRGLQTIASLLGLDKEEYCKFLVEVVNA